MSELRSFETSATNHPVTRCHISEDSNLHQHHNENLAVSLNLLRKVPKDLCTSSEMFCRWNQVLFFPEWKKVQSARFVRCFSHLTVNRINHSNVLGFEVIGRNFKYIRINAHFVSRTDDRILTKSASKFNVLLTVHRDISIQWEPTGCTI